MSENPIHVCLKGCDLVSVETSHMNLGAWFDANFPFNNHVGNIL